MAGVTLEAPTGGLDSTLGEILAQVRRLTPVDAAAFLVVDWQTRHIRPAAAWFGSERARAALDPMLRRAYEPERPGITEAALESGEPVLLRSVADWPEATAMRARLQRDHPADQVHLTWAWYENASLIACPVSSTEGRPFGVLCLSASPPLEPLDEETLRHVRVFADLAALALDRAAMVEDQARRSQEEAMLSEAASAVAESLDPLVVEERIAEQSLLLTGAEKVLLTRYRPHLGCLVSAVNRGYSEQVAGSRFAMGEGLIGRVAASRVPARWAAGDDGDVLRWVVEREGIGSVLHVPVVLGPRLFGVLSAAHRDPRALDEADLGRLVRFAASAAAALANATEHAHERRIAKALAGGFVPAPLDDLDPVHVAVRYDPAGSEGVGGDFYGAWRAGIGRVAVLVGDVAGKGVEVAALAAMVRFFIEARLPDAAGPADALAQADLLLRTRLTDERFATAWLGVLEGRRLRWASAGHPTPLLAGPRGVRALRGGGPALGVGDRGPRAEQVDELAGDELLVAFTDGLLEARRGGVPFAGPPLEQALRAAIGAPADPHTVIDHLHEAARAWAGELDDDVTVLALATR